MARFKGSYIFNMQTDRVAGWTESFYLETGDKNAAEGFVRDLKTYLMLLHGKQVILPRARVTDLDNPRKGKPVRFDNPAAENTGAFDDAVYPSLGLLLELEGESGATTRQWIKAYPKNQAGLGGAFTPTGDFTKAFNVFRKILTKTGSPWRIQINQDMFPQNMILGITDAGVLNVPANPIPDRARVRVSKVKTPAQANGDWTVLKNGADLLQLFGYAPTTGAVYTGPGKVLILDKVLEGIADARLVMGTERDAGRPTLTLGGSRTKRAK